MQRASVCAVHELGRCHRVRLEAVSRMHGTDAAVMFDGFFPANMFFAEQSQVANQSCECRWKREDSSVLGSRLCVVVSLS